MVTFEKYLISNLLKKIFKISFIIQSMALKKQLSNSCLSLGSKTYRDNNIILQSGSFAKNQDGDYPLKKNR